MGRFLLALTVCGTTLLAVAGCDDVKPRSGEGAAPGANSVPVATTFSSELSDDISGYYMPVGELKAGNWLLKDMFVGQISDFRSWENGSRTGTFAPVMLEFEDVSSPMTATELGEVRSGQIRVLPRRYRITDDTVSFEGRADGIGVVSFAGRLDGEALATARRNLGDESPVVTGTLKVGGRTFNDARFRWWAGD